MYGPGVKVLNLKIRGLWESTMDESLIFRFLTFHVLRLRQKPNDLILTMRQKYVPDVPVLKSCYLSCCCIEDNLRQSNMLSFMPPGMVKICIFFIIIIIYAPNIVLGTS